jgi:type II secretory pathway pseudopilin PulG
MQGLLSLRGALGRRLKDERGWALIDAIASAVVVVLAFTGTTMAFNGSTASVARDAKKTQAMIVAQNSINQMRGLGQSDIDALLALDNKTVPVTYRGVVYNVEYDAYYVTGLGSDQQDACAVAYASGGGTARYIYMRANVTYAGQSTSASGNADPYLSKPASLDSYYSPEGGGVQADTGTLRIYVLDRRAIVAGGVTNVKLYIAGDPNAILPQTSNTTTGCYLFTGLVRNTYQVKVKVSEKRYPYRQAGHRAAAVLDRDQQQLELRGSHSSWRRSQPVLRQVDRRHRGDQGLSDQRLLVHPDGHFVHAALQHFDCVDAAGRDVPESGGLRELRGPV